MKSHCSWIGKTGGRLLVLGLIAYFISKVIISAQKLQHVQIGTSKTTKYEDDRLFPSISICFVPTGPAGNYKYNGTELEIGLNITKQVTYLQ